MTILLYALGIVLFLAAIGLSIGLHEIGHLVPAKRFGVKVTHYMIGFGPTLFSFRRGETLYGVKLLPLGGFIAMPGMYPPRSMTRVTAAQVAGETSAAGIVSTAAAIRRTQADAGVVGASAAPLAAGALAADGAAGDAAEGAPKSRRRFMSETLDDAREVSNENLGPGEEIRSFYALSIPRRLAVMFGGPVMNLVLGTVIMAIMYLGIGTPGPSTTVQTVVECAVPATEAQQREAAGETDCRDSDPLTPAWETGIQPGDTITAVDGVQVDTWEQLSAEIRKSAGRTVPIELDRNGENLIFDVPIITSETAAVDEDGNMLTNSDGSVQTVTAGFLGISPTQELQALPVREFPGEVGEALGQTFTALANLPARLVDIGHVAFSDEQRAADGPIGMVGIGRVAGEIVSTDLIDVVGKVQLGLSLVASLNLFLFAFNLVPLLPLDGGHIAVALYEGARRRINLARGRGIVGPFDTAKLLPLTYGVVALMLTMTLLLVYVDLFKPITLSDIFSS